MKQIIRCCGNCKHYEFFLDDEGWCEETEEYVDEQTEPDGIDCKYFKYKEDGTED